MTQNQAKNPKNNETLNKCINKHHQLEIKILEMAQKNANKRRKDRRNDKNRIVQKRKTKTCKQKRQIEGMKNNH